ncbi:MAG: hypothetical protein AAF193_05465 [Bacteroidota bacterium]
MKKFLIALGLAFIGTGSFAQMTVENEVITIEMDYTTTRNELLDFRRSLVEYGIDFRYDNVDWADDQLLRINLTVKDANGVVRTFQTGNPQGAGTFKLVYKINSTDENDFCLGVDCQ